MDSHQLSVADGRSVVAATNYDDLHSDDQSAKTLLVISASPMGEHSVSNQVGQAFVDRYRSTFPNHKIDTLDISAGSLAPFTASRVAAKFKNQGGQNVDAEKNWVETKQMIERFKSADKIVFLLPTWNFWVPSDVKLYLDHIVQAHKTFNPSNYQGLVTGKPCLLVRTSSGVTIGSDMDTGTVYMKQILAFIGFTDIRVLAATGMPGPDGSRPWLEPVKKEAEAMAERFVFDANASPDLPKQLLLGAPELPQPAPLARGCKILHVSASPMGENSASMAVAEGFLAAARQQVGAVITHVDLAAMMQDGRLPPYTAARVKAKFATFGNADAELPADVVEDWEHTKGLINQCRQTDVILFSVPMWNLSIPYSLKRWMDHIAQPHKTFDPSTYQGLLGKRGFVVSASGSGLLGGPMDHVTPYMKQFCGFVGIAPVHHTYVNGTVGDKKQDNIDAAITAMKTQACL